MQSSKAFLLLEALVCLLLSSFALVLFVKFNSSPKTLSSPKILSPLHSPQFIHSSKSMILRSGDLEFEALRKVWESEGERFYILEDFK